MDLNYPHGLGADLRRDHAPGWNTDNTVCGRQYDCRPLPLAGQFNVIPDSPPTPTGSTGTEDCDVAINPFAVWQDRDYSFQFDPGMITARRLTIVDVRP